MLLPTQLYSHIPRKVENWTSRDVQKWFTIHNIQISKEFSFVKQNFNGKKFIETTPQYLMETCGVSSSIIMKKIIEWIEYDREQFEEYVEQHPQQQITEVNQRPSFHPSKRIQTKLYQSERPNKCDQQYGQQKNKENTPLPNFEQRHFQAIRPIEVQKWKKKVHTQESIVLQKKPSQRSSHNHQSNKSENCIPVGANFVKSSYEILENIIQFRYEEKSQFLNNSGKVGRNTCNDIIIAADSVSRKHAEIIKDKQQFYLKDASSKFGTFIRIGTKHRKTIEEGDIIAFEDSQIEILKFKYNKASNIFDARVRITGQKQSILNFYGKKSLVVGRDSKDIGFADPKIHINHAKISVQNGLLIITEQEGLCFKKLIKQELVRLDDGDQSIRLGLTVVVIKIINSHKAVPSISEFEYFKY